MLEYLRPRKHYVTVTDFSFLLDRDFVGCTYLLYQKLLYFPTLQMIPLLRAKTTEKLSYDWAIGTLSMVVSVIAKHAMVLTLRLVLNHHPGFGSQRPKDSFLVLKNINDSTLILFHQYFEVQNVKFTLTWEGWFIDYITF